ncbi:U3 small nucleolar RNA-associated protein 5 [Golovinomyces cichoracearum]|uniref:U3 small nucleolar RNA-associated protein 5 n=1 Tax=Golovinomyces cichoracearum TaxID=62708 RepID=A0A420ILT4_9PEZI|nr:U3 small nucleolar RNA-associated protein 5 [Golovinomyces cichoracearum]
MSTKLKLRKKLGQPSTKKSARVQGTNVLDESRTVVSSGHSVTNLQPDSINDAISITSDSSKEAEESNVESINENLVQNGDVTMRETKSTTEAPLREDADVLAQPSFRELVRDSISEPIDVTRTFHDDSLRVNNHPTSNIQPPPGASLASVLAQGLRTNDNALLETCLHTSDVNIIRATIQRLESSLAAKLLQKLAEKLHKRPGIARNLMVWVQWTLVAHGGYLASQRGLAQSLVELTKVIDERSRGLQSVLQLKGKLDMLEAQIELRRGIQDHQRRRDEEEEEDDDSIIYVEGQEDEESEKKELIKNSVMITSDGESDFSELSDDIPTMNGIIAESEDEEEYSSFDENLINDEAEDADSDMTDEDVEQHDDQSSEDGEDSNEAQPFKVAKSREYCSKKK